MTTTWIPGIVQVVLVLHGIVGHLIPEVRLSLFENV